MSSNRYGYFDDPNREYVIERPDVPVSWTNYIGVRDLCSVISHNAGGYTFHKSAQRGRITRFRPNGIPLDRPGKYVYLRDDETGDYWSTSWQPVGKDLKKANYETRHGLSYSKFRCRYKGIDAEQTVFIPLKEDVELWDVTIKNTGKKKRKISIFSFCEFSLHYVVLDNENFQYGLYASGSTCDKALGIIDYEYHYPRDPGTYYPVEGVKYPDPDGSHHFFASSFKPTSFDSERDSFIGSYRSEANPIAVEKGRCSNSQIAGFNHCGSLHKKFTLNPGQEIRFVYMLGVGSAKKEGKRAKAKFSNMKNVDSEFEKLRQYWDRKISVYQCNTPDKEVNSTVNIWNIYQAETCITWSRFASFVEVGGRTGLCFRDTSQDVMSVLHSNPDKCRQRIRELLTGQVEEGYAVHLFDPLTLRPGKEEAPPLDYTCSDDILWLVVTVCEYVKETGEIGLLDEVVPFMDHGEATVYDHLRKALDFSAKHVGKHGICSGLWADWNDCINLRGGGESAMVSFQHHWALQAFIEVAKFLGRKSDVKKYKAMAEKVRKACEKHLWDGKWYIRAITQKGIRVGTAKDKEGKLHLNAQSWAVYSGLADEKRGKMCMDAVDKHLYSKYGLHLVTPSYTKVDDDIGFVTRVIPGLKENGAIFSHANSWPIIAECLLGRGDRAFKFYSALLPAKQNDMIGIREAEPYSFCQFICGSEHSRHGLARHPWLTGSSGWMYTVITKYILGFKLEYDGFVIDPCIPKKWKGFTLTRKYRGATYNIEVKNPKHIEHGVKQVKLNGTPITFPIPPQKKGTTNTVEVIMG